LFCVFSVRTFEVHLGAQSIYDESEANLQIITSTDGQMHENYNSFTLENDICVIRLGQTVSGNGIGTIRLPSRSQAGETFDGDAAISSGWGRPSDCKFKVLAKISFFACFELNLNKFQINSRLFL